VIVPAIVVSVSNTSIEFILFVHVIIALGAIIFISAVTGLAIMFQIILNKAEYEKRKKAVCGKVVDQMKQNALKADEPTVGLVYDVFVKAKSDEEFVMEILQGKYLNRIPIPNDPDLTVDHRLVSQVQYRDYLRMITNAETE
jgi:hypothetical protein